MHCPIIRGRLWNAADFTSQAQAAPARRLWVGLSLPHADVDDYYWEPTVPPYMVKRPVDVRLKLMERMFVPRDAWVLTGSLVSWGAPLVERFDAVLFLVLERSTRLERLAQRERHRYGRSIDPDGDRAEAFEDFMAWAASYDDPEFVGRSLHGHERWLDALSCPVLRLNSEAPVPVLVEAIRGWDAGNEPSVPPLVS